MTGRKREKAVRVVRQADVSLLKVSVTGETLRNKIVFAFLQPKAEGLLN